MTELPAKKAQFEGTLKLTPEQRNGTWDTWTERVSKAMEQGDLVKAAHTLACCMVGPDTPKEELEQARKMFTLPELGPHHQKLWDLIVEDNELAYDDGTKVIRRPWEDKEKIGNFLFDEFGWNIR